MGQGWRTVRPAVEAAHQHGLWVSGVDDHIELVDVAEGARAGTVQLHGASRRQMDRIVDAYHRFPSFIASDRADARRA